MPTKVQFDKLALDWIEGVSDISAAVTLNEVKQTYRLTFDHCVNGTCKRPCAANPRCLSGLNGAGLAATLDKTLSTEAPVKGARRDIPAGLRNLGATCYVNSLLQVWFHDQEFRRLILKWDRNIDPGESDSTPTVPQTIIGHLQLVFARLLKSPKDTVDPTAFVEFLGLDIDYQQDASELADLLFTRIVEQLRMYPDQSLASELEEVFRGELVNVVECQLCNGARRSRDVFFRLNLNIQGVRSIQQCLRALGQKKNMDCEFRCYTCSGTGGAASYEELVALPPVLNLQLQRYRFDIKTGTRKKIKATVRFPPRLDMATFVKGIPGPLIYDLKAVLVHLGQTATSGHYIANVKVTMPHSEDAALSTTSRWFRLNDGTVSESKGRAEFDKELSTDNNGDASGESNGHKGESTNGQNSDGSDGSGDDIQIFEKMNLTSTNNQARHTIAHNENTLNNAAVKPEPVDSDKTNRSAIFPSNKNDEAEKIEKGKGLVLAKLVTNKTPKKSFNFADKSGSEEKKLSAADEDEVKKSDNELSSTGAYLLVYEKRKTDNSLGQNTDGGGAAARARKPIVAQSPPLLNYLQNIIDMEAAEFASLEAEAAALRSKAALQAQELRAELVEVSKQLTFIPEDGKQPCFVETSFLVAWIRATRELIKKLNEEQVTVHSSSAEAKPIVEETTNLLEKRSKNRNRKSAVIGSEVQKDGAQEEDDEPDDLTRSIRCPHGRLAPDATGLKIISNDGAKLLKELCQKHQLVEADLLRQQDVPQELCRECVIGLARRTLLAGRLAVDKKNFGKLLRTKDQPMYWISNRALQSWDKMVERRLTRELGLRTDDANEDFNGELLCEHGSLGLKSRKQIPQDAWRLIRQYFPDCAEFPCDHPDCALCMEESEEAQAAQAERKDTAVGLRARLSGLMKARRSFETDKLKGHLLHAEQADILRKFLRYPRGPRPTGFRNKLLCPHGGTLIDQPVLVSGGLLPEEVIFLSDAEWNLLCEEFAVHGTVEVTRELAEPNETALLSYEPAVCEPCVADVRTKAKQAALSFQNEWVTVQLVPLDELLTNKILPTRSEQVQDQAETAEGLEQRSSDTVAQAKQPLLGRGKRVKGNRLVQISSDDKFVDLKVKLMTLFNISPLLQVIVLNGYMIEAEGDVLLKDIGLKPGSVIYIGERNEDADEPDDDQEPSKKRTKKVEHGFAGTKLMG
ncbi:ubiquitin carboxyl-terminal hydrolase 48-like isoform X2 [Varroa jacobsoni]|uniref:ubiquitinyl hydrolase 1 n=1 Tax=Varroa destructor TaxID=109461 RepID=A0A7M7K109_VARDE|nr:ubiquitin carboxyl-terminal hydrolase 48-like [Varroa destructor]XP_022700464.1 ubiquitin carboxyl-terminal hydrolase 48-like isoform X2 [Varroa jacobsoni]